MKVFTLVYLVIILGFNGSHGGFSDGDGAFSPDEASNGSPELEGSDTPTPVASNDAINSEDGVDDGNKDPHETDHELEATASSDVEDVSAGQPNEQSSENVDSETENDPSNPTVIIDVSKPDSTICQYFDYDYDGAPTRRIVPKDGQTIVEVVSDDTTVYKMCNGENLDHLKAYLKDGHPEVIFVALKSGSGTRDEYLELKNGKWEGCTDYMQKIYGLRVETEYKGDLTIRIEDSMDTTECTIFEVNKCGVSTRFYYPKPGYHAKEVMDGSKSVWKGEEDEKAVMVRLHTSANSHLLFLSIKSGDQFTYKYFEMVGTEWHGIEKNEFDQKRKGMGTLENSSVSNETSALVQGDAREGSGDESSGPNTASEGRSDSQGLGLQDQGDLESDTDLERGSSYQNSESERKNSEISNRSTGSTSVRSSRTGGSNDLKISNLDAELCQTFEYHYDDVHTKLVVPREGVSITKVTDRRTFWTAKSGEKFEHAKFYLDNKGDTNLISITKSDSSGISHVYYHVKFFKWTSCNDLGDKMDKLKVTTEVKGTFTLSLEDKESTDECKVFETKILGAPVRLYFANPGYSAKEVKDGSTIIWTSYGNEKCVASDLYLNDGQPSLVLLTILSGTGKTFKHFEKSGTKWKIISRETFDVKLDGLMVKPIVSHDDSNLENAESADSMAGSLSSGDSHGSMGGEQDDPTEHSGDVLNPTSGSYSATSQHDEQSLNPTESKAPNGTSPEVLDSTANQHNEPSPENLPSDHPEEPLSSDQSEELKASDSSDTTNHSTKHAESKNVDQTPSATEVDDPLKDVTLDTTASEKADDQQTLLQTTHSQNPEDETPKPKDSTTDLSHGNGENKGHLSDDDGCDNGHESGNDDQEDLKGETEDSQTPDVSTDSSSVFPEQPSPEDNVSPMEQSHEAESPSPDVASKVDQTLFTTELGNDGGIPTLKLKVKDGQSPKKVTFDGKEVWSGGWISRLASSCSSAVLYFGGESPLLAVIYKLSGGKEEPKYRYHDGKKWQNGNAENHKTKLDELKDIAKNILNILPSGNSILRVHGVTVDGIPAKVLLINPDVKITEVKDNGKEVWKAGTDERCTYCTAFLKDGNQNAMVVRMDTGNGVSQKFYELQGDKWEASDEVKALKSDQATKPSKFILDLAYDGSTDRHDIVKSEKNGLAITTYILKSGHCIEKIKRGDSDVWTAQKGQTSFLCETYSKDNVMLVRVFLVNDRETSASCQRNEGGNWNEIPENELNNELLKWSTGGDEAPVVTPPLSNNGDDTSNATAGNDDPSSNDSPGNDEW